MCLKDAKDLNQTHNLDKLMYYSTVQPVILSSLSNSKIIMTTLVRKHDDAVLDIMQLYYSGQARASIPCFHHTSPVVRFLLPWLVLNKNPRSFCLLEDDQCCFCRMPKGEKNCVAGKGRFLSESLMRLKNIPNRAENLNFLTIQ